MYNIADKWFCRRWFIRRGSEVARGCFPRIVAIGSKSFDDQRGCSLEAEQRARCSAGRINHPRVQDVLLAARYEKRDRFTGIAGRSIKQKASTLSRIEAWSEMPPRRRSMSS
ncbi:hypothetical protein [Bradyrhizobium sp. UBA2491]|jgi:hypothetical protein|uniref:hypothetical protein n=1 Tax=Bradyrhizobium sp. UBA2491 TaxID=1946119 RepID=UPI000462FF0D|nr:hypothetical protein [Bradyrhizobium sp. UBA2491]KIU49578.1 hypothetical protein QU41_11630 [Bradyrhizobium elkanii]OCX31846.1 hypothetical protein QU42_06250 [Bradyrhizobium sp. UASWS1016]